MPGLALAKLRAGLRLQHDGGGLSRLSRARAFLRLRRARRLIAASRLAEAEALLTDWVARWPAHFGYRVQHAFCAHNAGRHAEALERWEHVRAHWPDHAFAWSGSAANARELGDLALAREIITAALRRFPDDGTAPSEAIRIFERLGETAGSLDHSGALLRLDPRDVEARRDHFARLAEAGRFDEAEELLRRIPADLAGDGRWTLCRARLALRRGDEADADRLLGTYAATIGSDRDRLAEMHRLAFALNLRHPAASQLIWTHLLRLDPKDAFTQHHHADALIRGGRYAEAEAAARAALEDHPGNDELLYDLALIALRTERWDEAVAGLEALLHRRPDHEEGRLSLAHARMERAQAELEGGTGAPSGAGHRATFAAERQDVGRVEDEASCALLLGFESIGQDCEFGLVQRRYGAEPLGLFRWNFTTPDLLRQAFEVGLDGLGDPACTLISLFDDHEYYLSDRRWGFAFHTWLSRHEADRDELYRKMCRRMTFLKRKLLADLADGEKIIVLKTFDADLAAVRGVLAGLRMFGDARLLWVRSLAMDGSLAATAPPGAVSELEPGLYAGTLTDFGNRQRGPWEIRFDEWLDLCRAATRVAARP